MPLVSRHTSGVQQPAETRLHIFTHHTWCIITSSHLHSEVDTQAEQGIHDQRCKYHDRYPGEATRPTWVIFRKLRMQMVGHGPLAYFLALERAKGYATHQELITKPWAPNPGW